jgi:hypothetical protein
VQNTFKELYLHVYVLSRTRSGESAVGKFLFRKLIYRLIMGIKFCLL